MMFSYTVVTSVVIGQVQVKPFDYCRHYNL